MADAPGGAAAMKATAPFAFRYQYLAGGVNTGSGWATWNTNGDVRALLHRGLDRQRHHSRLHLLPDAQSLTGRRQPRATRSTRTSNNVATMTAYLQRPEALLPEGGAFPGSSVVLHVEPDLWGYIQHRWRQRHRRRRKGFGDRPPGARGPAEQRRRGSHRPSSSCATPTRRTSPRLSRPACGELDNDIILSNPPDATVDALGSRAGGLLHLARRELRHRLCRVQRS